MNDSRIEALEAQVHRLEEQRHADARKSRRTRRIVVAAVTALLIGGTVTPVAANHLKVKTSDLTKAAVTTPKIKKGAITTPKLRSGAVKTPKLAAGAVTSAKIAADVPGIAIAGARVSPTGEVDHWFNRRGGKPVVTYIGDGQYQLKIPGTTITSKAILSVTGGAGLWGGCLGMGLSAPAGDFAANTIVVGCYDHTTGQPANRGFSLIVFSG
ncbi:hypothetical protein [Nocardioides limicola]|uniref:hypothetical protein n=1 Tax=Nocardioides limicola TaxID=2803368 RepID=UPI00193BE248|nr:hypothetical protein [Nocardioides sp. DJM-14]